MNKQSLEDRADEEIDLIDLLDAIIESTPMLLVLPFCIGLLTAAFSFFLPETFESVAIFRFKEKDLVIFQSESVLDIFRQDLMGLAEINKSEKNGNLNAKEKFSIVFDKKSEIVTLAAKGQTAEAAQKTAELIIHRAFEVIKVKGQEKTRIEMKIENNKRSIENLEDIFDLSKSIIMTKSNSDALRNRIISELLAVNYEINKLNQENILLLNELESRELDDYVQRPSLPLNKVAPKRVFISLLATSISMVALLFFVIVRQQWLRVLEKTPHLSEKIERISGKLKMNSLNLRGIFWRS